MANERYLVLNRHGISIMKTFFTEAVGPDSRFLLRTRTHFFFSKLTIQNTFLSHRIEKSFKIIENIRITISKDHNN